MGYRGDVKWFNTVPQRIANKTLELQRCRVQQVCGTHFTLCLLLLSITIYSVQSHSYFIVKETEVETNYPNHTGVALIFILIFLHVLIT